MSILRLPEHILRLSQSATKEAVRANREHWKEFGVDGIHPEGRWTQPVVDHHQISFPMFTTSEWGLATAAAITLRAILDGSLSKECSLSPNFDQSTADRDQQLAAMFLNAWSGGEKTWKELITRLNDDLGFFYWLWCEEFMLWEKGFLEKFANPKEPDKKYSYKLQLLENDRPGDWARILVIYTNHSSLPVSNRDSIEISPDCQLDAWHLETFHYLQKIGIKPEEIPCVTLTFPCSNFDQSGNEYCGPLSSRVRKTLDGLRITLGIVGCHSRMAPDEETLKAVRTHQLIAQQLTRIQQLDVQFGTRNMLYFSKPEYGDRGANRDDYLLAKTAILTKLELLGYHLTRSFSCFG